MKTSYIEQMSVADRNNSLSGYYHSLIRKYNEFFKEKIVSSGGDSDICCRVINSGYISFAAILQRNTNLEEIQNLQDGVPNVYTSEEYAAHKFALSKNLNLIEKVIYKLCYGSIDSSITEGEAEIESVKQAMTWMFVDCVDCDRPSYQDVARVKMILSKKDILESVGEVNDKKEKISGDSLKRRCIEHLNRKVTNNHIQKATGGVKAMNAYKTVIRNTLNDMFDVLSNLLNFSQYLAVVEETAYPNIMPNSTFQTLEELKTRPNMQKILALAEGVKTVLIEYFVSFVKIKEISLPHSYLSFAQFNHSTITNGNFMSSEIENANMEFASARDCDFSMCSMDNISASHADFTRCNFNYSSMIGADLSNAVLNETALNSITLLDDRILQPDLYSDRGGDADFQISYADAENEIKELFNKFTHNVSLKDPDLRIDIVSRLGKHYKGENGLSQTLEVPLNKEQYDFKYIIKHNDYGCVLDKLNREVNNVLEKYDKWCDSRFPHPKCLEWASKDSIRNSVTVNSANLDSASIKDAVMPDCVFSTIKIKNASFQNTDLNSSTYFYTNAIGAFFGESNMAQAKAGYSDFNNATFNKANLINSQFINCRLSETNFSNANLIDSVIMDTSGELFYNKVLEDYIDNEGLCVIKIQESDIDAKKTEFIGNAAIACADMQDSDFSYSLANNISIVGMNIDRSIFSGANLKRSFIYNCLSRWTDYSEANISYALIIGNAFGHSSLCNANLTSARIFACDFSDCDMRNVNLINARVDNTIFSNCDLEQTNFSNTLFVNCLFQNLNLNNANFTNCVFMNCMIESVSLENERNLITAIFDRCCFVDKDTYSNIESIARDHNVAVDDLIFLGCERRT